MHREVTEWNIIKVYQRFDSSNYNEIVDRVHQALDAGKLHIAFDLSEQKFLSIPAIRYLVTLSEELTQKGGRLALLGPSIKTLKHIEVFGNVKKMSIHQEAHQLPIVSQNEVRVS